MKLAHLLSYLNQYASSVSSNKKITFFFVGQNENIVRHGFNLIWFPVSSVTQSCLDSCNPIAAACQASCHISTPELAQIHVH